MPDRFLFGAIADDFTGGSDLAGMLFEAGVATVQMFGIPEASLLEQVQRTAQAAVLSLKSRSIRPRDAVRVSLDALYALRSIDARQIQFKYCSTFDSTSEGNIGPVTEALLSGIGTSFTIAVPALPVNGRTQYLGHLFVRRELLSDSPLRHHPLNPMDDANLVRHLQKQTTLRVGLINLFVVMAGAGAIRQEMHRLEAEGVSIALVDAIRDADLGNIAEACADMPLITGGSGLAGPLANVWRQRGWIEERDQRRTGPSSKQRTLILAGSCSAATLAQLDAYRAAGEVLPFGTELETVGRCLEESGTAVVASSAVAGERDLSPGASERIEKWFGNLAREAHTALGVKRFIVAGGETSGAVVEALGVTAAEVTGIVAPGVPSLRTLGHDGLRLVLKSGNFGGRDFFRDAVSHLNSHGN